jgi:hypothetical protein
MKISRIMAISMAILCITGCGEEANVGKRTTAGGSPTVEEVLAAGMSSEPDEASEEDSEDDLSDIYEYLQAQEIQDNTEEEISETAASASTSEEEELSDLADADYIDLTALSSTMVYSEVYEMMYYPEKFVGKVVKAEGIFSDFYDEEKDKNYFGCIIMDATACCAQGIEFEPLPNYSYPGDFPNDGDMVTVEGTFDTYEEDGYTYCTLREATFR